MFGYSEMRGIGSMVFRGPGIEGTENPYFLCVFGGGGGVVGYEVGSF